MPSFGLLMTTAIRLANLETDRGQLIDAMGKWLSPQLNGARFDWLYKGSPYGEACVWIATRGEGGPLIGAAAAFPRTMYVAGVQKKACVLGDFFIAPEYRSLGPALQLQRACMSVMDSGCFEICYDFPAVAMLPVYKRLSIAPADKLVRMAKPLRADRKIREWVKVPAVARGLGAAANQILKVKNRITANPRVCKTSVLEDPCGDEFTALARSVSASYGICTQRSADYLNWRYKNHFARRFEILVARRESKLLAYAVCALEGEDGEITDLFGCDEPEPLAELIKAVADRFYSRGAVTLSMSILASHPWVGMFEKWGFHTRESCPVICIHPSQPRPNDSAERHSWFLTQGDRES